MVRYTTGLNSDTLYGLTGNVVGDCGGEVDDGLGHEHHRNQWVGGELNNTVDGTTVVINKGYDVTSNQLSGRVTGEVVTGQEVTICSTGKQ